MDDVLTPWLYGGQVIYDRIERALAEVRLLRPTSVFLDLDGVLADFHAGVCRVFGRHLKPPTDYKTAYLEEVGLSRTQFWRQVAAAGEDFWADLPLLPWAHRLVKDCESTGAGLFILTSPTLAPSSFSGKAAWVDRHLPRLAGSLIITRAPKEVLSAPGLVLVDDRPANVNAWLSMGGRSVLWPAPWNDGP